MPTTILKRLTPYVITMALAGFLYVQADHFDMVSQAGRPGPDLWPKISCVILGVSSLFGMIGAFLGPQQDDADLSERDEAALSPPEIHPQLVWIGIGATALYVWALPWLGFFIATVLFAMALLVIGGMRRWAWLPVVAMVLASVFMLIFMKVVYVALPLGEGWFKLVSLAVFKLIGVH